jgi:hypothetical protein
MEKDRSSDSGAQFVGWQRTPSGELVALYMVTAAKHPLYRSTVSEQTLRQHHLQIPFMPAPAAKSSDSDLQR